MIQIPIVFIKFVHITLPYGLLTCCVMPAHEKSRTIRRVGVHENIVAIIHHQEINVSMLGVLFCMQDIPNCKHRTVTSKEDFKESVVYSGRSKVLNHIVLVCKISFLHQKAPLRRLLNFGF